jgi:hypothetical protein
MLNSIELVNVDEEEEAMFCLKVVSFFFCFFVTSDVPRGSATDLFSSVPDNPDTPHGHLPVKVTSSLPSQPASASRASPREGPLEQ